VVVGDSVADSLSWGLRAVAAREGIRLEDAARPGCGVAAGFTLDSEMQPFPYSATCDAAFPDALDGVVARFDPDLFVWHSVPELANRLERGRALKFATPEHDAALFVAMSDALQRLTSGGARVVILTAVPRAAGIAGPVETND
jgi:hypothetical protein